MAILVEDRSGFTILLISPDADSAVKAFEAHEIIRAKNVDEAIALLKDKKPDFILCDFSDDKNSLAGLLNLAFQHSALVCFALDEPHGAALKALDLSDIAETLSGLADAKSDPGLFKSLGFSAYVSASIRKWEEAFDLVKSLDADPKPFTSALRKISREGLKAEIKNGIILVSKAQR